MKKINWPLIFNILIFFLAQYLMWSPRFFYFLLILINIFIILSLYFYIGNKYLSLAWLKFLILPILFWNGLLFYLSLIPYSGFLLSAFIQFWLLLALYFQFSYLRQAKKLLQRKNNNLELSFSIFSFLTVFFLAAAVYGWQSFMAWPVWPLALFLALSASLLCYELIWINLPDKKPENLLLSAIPFVFLQLSWTLFFLPFDYHVLSLFFVLYFYLATSLVTMYLRRSFGGKNLRQLLTFFIFCLAFVMLLVKWS